MSFLTTFAQQYVCQPIKKNFKITQDIPLKKYERVNKCYKDAKEGTYEAIKFKQKTEMEDERSYLSKIVLQHFSLLLQYLSIKQINSKHYYAVNTITILLESLITLTVSYSTRIIMTEGFLFAVQSVVA